MLKIRLRRMGKCHRPFYRVVVSDSRAVPSAPAVEELGYYDPTRQPKAVSIDLARVEHWVEKGARLSPTVAKLVRRNGEGLAEPADAGKPAVLESSAPAGSSAPAEEAAPAAEAAATDEAPATDEAAPAEEAADTADAAEAPKAEASGTEAASDEATAQAEPEEPAESAEAAEAAEGDEKNPSAEA